MLTLAQQIELLEVARSQGLPVGRHLEVIETQVARAEEKVANMTKANPLFRNNAAAA